MHSIFILGRQPALGLAELESLFGAAALRPAGEHAAVLDIGPAEVHFGRLGGSTKFGKVLTILDTTDWKEIEKYLTRTIPEEAEKLPGGKLTIGISVIDLKVRPAAIQALGLTLKKVIRKSGRPVRLVPNKEPELNTAQVLHNNLAGENGMEVLLVRDGTHTIVAQTTQVQDIESYTLRDRGRPRRDARVGMLPPKLAQIIINLATYNIANKNQEGITYFDEAPAILDPFCGTGVVLQEAKLMGFSVYGTDVEPRMVEYSAANLEWLTGTFPDSNTETRLETGDATTHQWNPLPDFVACETYLGRPFTSLPTPEILNRTISECNLIIKKFLKNIGTQAPSGTRLCLAVPAWQTKPNSFKHLPLIGRDIDQIADMGYNRISFEHVRSEELLYYRPDQVVARELLILEKK